MLPREYKLKRDNDFRVVFKQGKYYQGNFIKIRFFKNSLDFSRFAFIIGLKISKKAATRNRIRRRLEEITRLGFERITNGFDIIIMVDPQITKKSYKEIENELVVVLKKTKLIN